MRSKIQLLLYLIEINNSLEITKSALPKATTKALAHDFDDYKIEETEKSKVTGYSLMSISGKGRKIRGPYL